VKNDTREGQSYYATAMGNHVLYRTMTFPMTFTDLWRSFQSYSQGSAATRLGAVGNKDLVGNLCRLVTLCAQLTRDLLAIAKFLVLSSFCCCENMRQKRFHISAFSDPDG